MELSRRDALAALASAGVAVGVAGTGALGRDDESDGDGGATETRDDGAAAVDTDTVLSTLTATAEVVYPSAVSNVGSFVETYATRKLDARPDYRAGVAATVADLNDYVAVYADAPRFAALPVEDRDAVLRRMSVDTADPDPDGTVTGRVRYYVVNDLLFALYSSPTGGELVGIENPQGHPGGRTHSEGPER